MTFVHGLGSSKESPRNVVIAERLRDSGIASLLFDLSGHGDSSRDPRDGEISYLEDLETAFRWVSRQAEVDSRRLGVAGSSLGGVVALRAATRHLVQPAAMVLRAPPVDPCDFVRLAVPTLVVIGSRDLLLASVREAAAMSEAVTLFVVAGAGHLFEEPGTLEVATTRTVQWFRAQLTTKEELPPRRDTGGGDPQGGGR